MPRSASCPWRPRADRGVDHIPRTLWEAAGTHSIPRDAAATDDTRAASRRRTTEANLATTHGRWAEGFLVPNSHP